MSPVPVFLPWALHKLQRQENAATFFRPALQRCGVRTKTVRERSGRLVFSGGEKTEIRTCGWLAEVGSAPPAVPACRALGSRAPRARVACPALQDAELGLRARRGRAGPEAGAACSPSLRADPRNDFFPSTVSALSFIRSACGHCCPRGSGWPARPLGYNGRRRELSGAGGCGARAGGAPSAPVSAAGLWRAGWRRVGVGGLKSLRQKRFQEAISFKISPNGHAPRNRALRSCSNGLHCYKHVYLKKKKIQSSICWRF